jgi:hypothetical protein
MVSGTIALLRSINPKLTAAEIKKILTDTAAPGVPGKNQSVPIPDGMGAGVLRVDEAVLKVINDMTGKGYKLDDLLKLATIEGSATSKLPTEFEVKATIPSVRDSETTLSIELQGEGSVGDSKKTLTSAGSVTWNVSTLEGKDPPTAHICRLDTDSCCDLSLSPVDLNGHWNGNMTITDVKVSSDITIPDPLDDTKEPTVIKKEECEKSMKDALGKPIPMIMEFRATSPTAGTMSIITTSSGKESKSDSIPYTFTGGKVTMNTTQSGFTIHFEGTITEGEADFTLSGSFSQRAVDEKGAESLSMSGTFSVAKPKTEQ